MINISDIILCDAELGYEVVKDLLHGERSSSEFASVWVQEGQFQTAQCGQANLIFDAHYLHQLLLLHTKTTFFNQSRNKRIWDALALQ